MYLVFDIGGTNTRVGVSADLHTLLEYKSAPTPQEPNAGLALILKLSTELLNGQKVTAIAGGVAGLVDAKEGILTHSPNLPTWERFPLAKKVADYMSAETSIYNDTMLLGLGEATRGAGKDFEIVAFLGIGTGVGGTRIISGVVDEAKFGFEPGHQIISIDSEGSPITLESQVGAAALRKRYNKPVSDLESEQWEIVHEALAIGIYNTNLYWSPDVIVLGGGMILHQPIKLEKLSTILLELNAGNFPEPLLKAAELKDTAGLHGALQTLAQNV